MPLIAYTVKGSADGDTVETDEIDTTGADFILLSVAQYDSGNPITDTYFNSWSPLGAIGLDFFSTIEYLYCLNPITGPGHKFACTPVVSNKRPVLSAQAWSGVGVYEGDAGHVSQTANSIAFDPVTPSVGALIVTSCAIDVASAATPSVGFTKLGEELRTALHPGLADAYMFAPSTSPITAGWAWPDAVTARGGNIAVFSYTEPEEEVLPENPCTGGGEVEIGEDPPDGVAMATSKTPEVWAVLHLDSGDLPVSALALPDPLTYHGGHKEPRLLDVSTVRLAVSDQFGGPQTSDHTLTVIDTDYRFRTRQRAETMEGRTYTVWMADDATRRAQGIARRRGHFVITSVEPVGDMTYKIHGSDFVGSVLSRFHADKRLHDRTLNRTLFPQLPLALDGKVQPGYYGWIGDDSLPTLEVDPVALDPTQGYGGVMDGAFSDFGWGTVGVAGPASLTLGEGGGGEYSSADTVYVMVTAVVGGVESDPYPATDGAGEAFTFTGSGKKLTLACAAVPGATAYRWYVSVNAQWGHTATPRDASVRTETATNSAELTDAGNENVGPWPPPDTRWSGTTGGPMYVVVLARYAGGLTPRQTNAGFLKHGPWVTRPVRVAWTPPASTPDEYWVISVFPGSANYINKWIVAGDQTYLDLTRATLPDEAINGSVVQEGAIPLPHVGDELIGGTNYRVFLGSLGVIRINDLHGSDLATPATRIRLDAAVYGSTFLVPGKTGWPFATLYRSFVDEAGDDQWFTLVYGLAGDPVVEAAVDGTVPLTANTCGFAEDSRGVDDADAISPTIDSLADQILHFLENFGNPQDGEIWKSGPWKTPHLRNGVPVHRGSAFQTARDYAETLVAGGFKGAWGFAVNLEPFDLGTFLRAAAINHDWRWNTNEHGQFEPLMVDPGAPAVAAFSDGSVLGTVAANIPNHAQVQYVPSTSRRINEITYVYKKNYVPPVTKPTPAEDDLLPPTLSESVDWYSGTLLERNDASQLAFGGGGGRRDVKPLTVQFSMHRTSSGPSIITARLSSRWGFPPDVWRFPASLLGVDVKNGQVVTWTHHAGTGSAGAVARSLWLAASDVHANIVPADSSSLDVWLDGEDITDLEDTVLLGSETDSSEFELLGDETEPDRALLGSEV